MELECKECEGKGQVLCKSCIGFDPFCFRCLGSGIEACPECSGSGHE